MRDIKYNAAHMRVRRRRGRAQEHNCTDCGDHAQEWAYTHDCPVAGSELRRMPHGKWSLVYYCRCDDSRHYDPLCIDCHRFLDHAIKECTS